jgi:hypothetical protein
MLKTRKSNGGYIYWKRYGRRWIVEDTKKPWQLANDRLATLDSYVLEPHRG